MIHYLDIGNYQINISGFFLAISLGGSTAVVVAELVYGMWDKKDE